MKKDLRQKLKKVKLLLMDVDGVLTNAQIVYDDQGKEIKFFHVHDGFGIVLLRKSGVKTAILTARYSKAVDVRAKDLNIDKVIQEANPKLPSYKKILNKFKLKDEEVCFVADDLTDLSVFLRVGVSIAVPHAVSEIKRKADYITKHEGGKGAIREVVEMILTAQGKWKNLVESFQIS